LLETKFYKAPLRPDLVARPHLHTRLSALLQPGCRLALVSAPAGFGKTTLVSSWADVCECHVTWLSLDETDNEPSRFWSYIATAFNVLADGLGDALLTSVRVQQSLHMETLLVDLINRLSNLSVPAVLVLDDYHFISDPGIHEDLLFLIQHLPPSIHLVIVTRSNPPWPLARLRSSGQMIELRTRDLRFTADEVDTFLREVMALPLSPAAVAVLNHRTEGWITSLHLAVLSLRGSQDTDAFVSSFSSSHRFILDYLIEEVLGRQAPDVVSFLLQTSILDRMSASLCDAVTGRKDALQLLSMLEAENLFVVPLDDHRHWYRYHHLFADLLRTRLQQTRGNEVAELHIRASAWYHRVGLIPEALHHALVGGDVERAAHVVEGNIMALLDHGELKTLAEWLDKLPGDVTLTHPWLCLARAWVLVYTGEYERASTFLACAETIQLDYERLGRIDEARHIAGHIMAGRAYQIAYQRDFQKSADLSAEALTLLPMEDATTRCFASLLRSALLRRMGVLETADEILDQALHNEFLPPDSHTAVLARCNLGILRRVQGRLHEVAAIFRRIISENATILVKSSDYLPPATLALAYLGLAEVHHEWNDLTTAEQLVREGIDRAERWGSAEMLSGAYLHLARILQASGNEVGMRTALENMLDITQANLPSMIPVAQSDCAAILLSFGDVKAAISWAESCGLNYDDDFDLQDRQMYIVLARVLQEQGQFEQDEILVSRLVEGAVRIGAVSDLIQILAIQALLKDAQGNTLQAFADLDRAFALAEPEGFIRIFLDLGPQMIDLLRKARVAGLSKRYVDVLLAAESIPAAEQEDVLVPETTTQSPSQAGLIEPLSERELQVLRFLRSSMTNAEIADHLYVSVNTVRSHIQHVYEKLDVHRRFDAVETAKKLGLL
jgi:LuxR family maltose regulon positive regulatory protein